MESFKRLMVLLLGGICLAGLIGLYAYFWFHDYYRLVKVYLEWWGKGHALLLAIYGILLFFFFCGLLLFSIKFSPFFGI